jgi:nicotinamide mononucleotide transporter
MLILQLNDSLHICPHMEWTTWIEVLAVTLSLTFLVLLIREVRWCWPFGIVSSALSVAIFIHTKLYSEAILYVFYVFIGFYGWWIWSRKHQAGEEGVEVHLHSNRSRLLAFVLGSAGAGLLGWWFNTNSDAAHPFVDATTTSFSFVASFLEAHKVFSVWIYWIIINGVSVWLYFDRGLTIYSMLMVVYFGVSVYGWFDWKKKLKVVKA